MQCAIFFRKKIYNYFSSINCLVVIFIATLTFISLASFYMKDASHKRSYSERLSYRDINDYDHTKLEQTKMMLEISEDVNELWFYIKSEMNKILKEGKVATEMMERIADYKNDILDNINVADQVDSELRRKQINRLSEVVQNNLHQLQVIRFYSLIIILVNNVEATQNPQNCESAKKVICRLIDCGLGCIVHHVIYCMFMAYGTNRTLVLGYGGRYARMWKLWFEPVSSCPYNYSLTETNWNDLENPMECKNLNLKLPYWGRMLNKPKFILPQTIPNEISPILSRLHGYPFVWWAGQFIRYLLRPTKHLQQLIENSGKKLKFQHPILGIHVRRSDKLKREASLHNLSEYMEHADEYYQQLQTKQPNIERRVYLASDDVQIFQEARKRYPKYTFIGDPSISKDAVPEKRHSNESLLGIILDVHFLYHSEVFVCTLSSNVGRLVYALMQTANLDASSHVRSVDELYYFHTTPTYDFKAILPHTAVDKNEINLTVGDIIVKSIKNQWNGYFKGTIKGTNHTGTFPLFKVRDVIRQASFGNYSYPKVSCQKNNDMK